MPATQILNETLTSPGVFHAMFVRYKRILVPQNASLYKFTDRTLWHGGKASPWWAFVSGGPAGDPGFDGFMTQAKKSGMPLAEYVRDVFAVRKEWGNTQSIPQSGFMRVQRIKLLQPVYGFYGPCQHVPGKTPPLAYPEKDQANFAGGAMQLYIPNLTPSHVMDGGLSLH